MYFNSQPHKEADDRKAGLYDLAKNFNSQPHKEADLTALDKALNGKISTHSLTRRLTDTQTIYNWDSDSISTHSLTRRLTYIRRLEKIQEYISTHSLTRRLTKYLQFPVSRWVFQLTASQGG